MKPIRTDDEINDLLDACNEARDVGRTQFPELSYEMGVAATVAWLTDEDEPHPLEE